MGLDQWHIFQPGGETCRAFLRRETKSTELESLNAAPWRHMLMILAVDEVEVRPETGGKACAGIALDGKAAAFFRAIKRESADDDTGGGVQGCPHHAAITLPVVVFGEEMEGRPSCQRS